MGKAAPRPPRKATFAGLPDPGTGNSAPRRLALDYGSTCVLVDGAGADSWLWEGTFREAVALVIAERALVGWELTTGSYDLEERYLVWLLLCHAGLRAWGVSPTATDRRRSQEGVEKNNPADARQIWPLLYDENDPYEPKVWRPEFVDPHAPLTLSQFQVRERYRGYPTFPPEYMEYLVSGCGLDDAAEWAWVKQHAISAWWALSGGGDRAEYERMETGAGTYGTARKGQPRTTYRRWAKAGTKGYGDPKFRARLRVGRKLSRQVFGRMKALMPGNLIPTTGIVNPA